MCDPNYCLVIKVLKGWLFLSKDFKESVRGSRLSQCHPHFLALQNGRENPTCASEVAERRGICCYGWRRAITNPPSAFVLCPFLLVLPKPGCAHTMRIVAEKKAEQSGYRPVSVAVSQGVHA